MGAKEIPSVINEAVYVWFALNPRGKTKVNTSYVGQTGNIRQRSSQHTDKLNGDMDLIIFSLEGSTENHRQVIEHLVYHYLMRVENREYLDVKINLVEPLLPTKITLKMLDEAYEEFHKIAGDLQKYLGVELSSRDIPYLTYCEFLERYKGDVKRTIIEPTLSTPNIEVYNPLHHTSLMKESMLVKGSIIYLEGHYYTYTNKLGQPYHRTDDLVKYLSAPHNRIWFEPLESIMSDKQLQYIGRSN